MNDQHMTPEYIHRMVAKRNRALLSLNADDILSYMDNYSPDEAWCMRDHLATRPDLFWASVHKARCSVTTFSEKVYNESAKWLRDHNFNVPPREVTP